jgi:hypothetical protein
MTNFKNLKNEKQTILNYIKNNPGKKIIYISPWWNNKQGLIDIKIIDYVRDKIKASYKNVLIISPVYNNKKIKENTYQNKIFKLWQSILKSGAIDFVRYVTTAEMLEYFQKSSKKISPNYYATHYADCYKVLEELYICKNKRIKAYYGNEMIISIDSIIQNSLRTNQDEIFKSQLSQTAGVFPIRSNRTGLIKEIITDIKEDPSKSALLNLPKPTFKKLINEIANVIIKITEDIQGATSRGKTVGFLSTVIASFGYDDMNKRIKTNKQIAFYTESRIKKLNPDHLIIHAGKPSYHLKTKKSDGNLAADGEAFMIIWEKVIRANSPYISYAYFLSAKDIYEYFIRFPFFNRRIWLPVKNKIPKEYSFKDANDSVGSTKERILCSRYQVKIVNNTKDIDYAMEYDFGSFTKKHI